MAQAQVNSFFTPTQISGCQLWFDAANSASVSRLGNSVTSWTSRGENSLVISQSSSNPTYVQNRYNSLPTLRFSFGNTLPLSNATVSSSIVQTSLSYTIFLVHLPNANNSTPFAFLTGGGSRLSVVTPESSNISYDGISTRLSYSYPSQAAYLNGALRMEAFYSLSSTGFYRRDGSQLATATLGSGTYNSTQNFFIGGAVPNYPGYYYGGDICEVVWFNVGLTTAQIQQVEGYLAWKWGLQANLPATHPYKNSPISPLLNPPTSIPRAIQTNFFVPTQISGCQLWLDAADRATVTLSGSTVTQWRDKSENNNNTNSVTGTPQYISNGVYFNGSAAMFGPIANTINVMSSFLVGAVNNSTALDGRILSFAIQGQADFQSSTRVIPFFRLGTSSAISTYRNPSNASAVTITYDTPFLAGTFFDGTNCLFFLNGTQGGSIASSTGNFNYNRYGLSQDAGGVDSQRLVGYIYEVISYNASLTISQRQQVEGYLAWKWGLQSSLPATHPYKNSPIPPLLNPPTTLPAVLFRNWLPTQISGISVWYDASDLTTLTFSGQNVTQWRDKSGNGYTLTAVGSPTTQLFNNRTVIVFNGSPYFQNASFTNTGPYAIFYVMKFNFLGTTNGDWQTITDNISPL